MNQEELNESEEKRKKTYFKIKLLNSTIILLITIAIVDILMIPVVWVLWALIDPISLLILSLFIVVLLTIVAMYIKDNLKKSLEKDIFKTVYSPIFKEKEIEFNYEGLRREEVLSSNLFSNPDIFKSSSLIRGSILSFPYKASNIALWIEVPGEYTNSKYKIFEGRLYILETSFNKEGIVIKSKPTETKGLIRKLKLLLGLAFLVLAIEYLLQHPKKILSLFLFVAIILIIYYLPKLNEISKKMHEKGYRKVKLGNGTFDRLFCVTTKDQIELRKTLTPIVMEKLINLRKTIEDFDISIIGNKIYLAFPKKVEISLNRSIQDLINKTEKTIEEEIEAVKLILEALNLKLDEGKNQNRYAKKGYDGITWETFGTNQLK